MKPRTAGPLRVLVADDNADNVVSMELLLRQRGYATLGVFDGQAALDAVKAFDPDVVLLDIGMPKLSGWAAAREIRKISARRLTLIGISGEYLQHSDQALAKLSGFDHYLRKPAEPEQVFDLLQSVAERLTQSG